MPFITQLRRAGIANGTIKGQDFEPGDLCYLVYKEIIRKWKANPRWITAHRIYENDVLSITMTREQAAAAQLAWQCFFYLHVLPYEEKKRKENGDIY